MRTLHETPPQNQPQTAPAVVSNALAALVCRVLTLRPEHRAKMHARGLGLSEVKRLHYVSAPVTADERQRTADALAPYLEAAGGGVPGFYRDGGRWRMVFRPSGVFVPVRNELGHVEALTQRVDEPRAGAKYIWLSSADREGGASSGAPPHFAGRHLLLYYTPEVTITEGSLKADVASYLSGSPIIGVAGTHATRGLATRLKSGFPLLRRVFVAYDRDMMEKPQVLDALLKLSAQLEAVGFEVRVRTWRGSAKGYDDYLLSQISSREVAA